VKRAGEAAHAAGKGQVGVGQGRADKVRGVGADVAALVIGVDDHVQAHKLNKLGVVKAKHVAKVGGP
jgi:hypothetical protein